MINYFDLSINDGLETPPDNEFQPDSDGKYIEQLWDKVRLNDLDSLEAVHSTLYPLLFKYVYFIIQDPAAADEIIGEAFIHFWYQRNETAGKMLKAGMVKYIRQAVIFYLTRPVLNGKGKAEVLLIEAEHPVVLLSAYNGLSSKEKERIFLRESLKLDGTTIAEILGY
ncbi:MAG TPA: hypothetical protein VIM16_08265 [Mucilaginibacter sp.]